MAKVRKWLYPAAPRRSPMKVPQWRPFWTGLLMLFILLLLYLNFPVYAGTDVRLDVAFLGERGEFVVGVGFSAGLGIAGDLAALGKVLISGGRQGFGVGVGWSLSSWWLSVMGLLVGEETRRGVEWGMRMGVGLGLTFELLGRLYYYNEFSAYMPLGERGGVQPVFSVGVGVIF